MTNLTKTLMVAAAALVMAGAASAQTLKANIPFAFRAGEKLMQPGTYRVSVVNGAGGIEVFQLRNEDASDAVLSLPYTKHDPSKEWQADGRPRLAFYCGASRCSLAEIWRGGTSNVSYSFKRPKSPDFEQARLEVIYLEPGKSE